VRILYTLNRKDATINIFVRTKQENKQGGDQTDKRTNERIHV